ncbi:MAG: hypothetical protein JNL66_03710 [Alphaproteobacteria bacterium]|nr:hypothetical protein [Alphaproteobacteria bacterium]
MTAKQGAGGAAGAFETYETITNVVWQTRPAAPSDYEYRLADGLMAAFDAGVVDLSALAAHLNQQKISAPDGAAWTEATLAAELQRLGR